MKKILTFLKGLRPSFYLMLLALVLASIGFATYFETMSAFDFVIDRWVILLSVAAIVLLSFALVNTVVMGNQFGMVFVYVAAVAFLVLAACFYLSPCLPPIGIYFTVGNMGNVEANAVGVPSCIKGMIFYVIASLAVVACGFFRSVKEGGSIMELAVGGKK